MCMAAQTAIAQVDDILPLGLIHPETIVTPGIFVGRVVHKDAEMDEQPEKAQPRPRPRGRWPPTFPRAAT